MPGTTAVPPRPWAARGPTGTDIAPSVLGAPSWFPVARTVLVFVTLTCVLGAFGWRCARIAWNDSITSDESTHLIRLLNYWRTGDDLAMWELGAPRFPHALYARASAAALRPGMMPPSNDPDGLASIARLVYSGSHRVLFPARLVAIGWGIVLLGSVYWATARVRGPIVGLVAALIVSLVPEVVAHASIAGSDMPFTAAAFVSLALLALYAERPSPWRLAAAAMAIGTAWAMRHSALMLLLLTGMIDFAVRWRRQSPVRASAVPEMLLRTAGVSAFVGLTAFLVLWAGDGFGVVTVSTLSERAITLNIPRSIGPVDLSNLAIPTSALSVLKQVRHQSQGHEAYFLGRIGSAGWPAYFPVAFLLKTPVALIGLMVLAIARVRPRGRWEWILVTTAALLWIMLVRNRVNIGVRYALLTYPLAAPFVARMFDPRMLRDRVWTPVAVALAVWFAWTSWSCLDRPLSYFNEVGGGPSKGWLYLADSNIDWGQDLDRLIETAERLGIREVTYDVSSNRPLVLRDGVAYANPSRAYQVPAETPPNRRLWDSEGHYLPVHTRYIAVSVSRLLGLYSQNDMSWLKTRRLVARAGDSMFLFDMDRPAEAPLESL